MDMTLNTTLIWLGLFASLTAFAGYRGAQPPSLKQTEPRMVPWRFVMLLAATATIVLIVHMLTLLGLKTDPPPRY